MNRFYDQMFNPSYVDQKYYNVNREQQYRENQELEVEKAVNATNDLCKAFKKMDNEFQSKAFEKCLIVIVQNFGENQQNFQ